MGFDRADLLRQADVVEGAILPLVAFSSGQGTMSSTTSTTYQNAQSALRIKLTYDTIRPDNTTLVFNLTGQFNAGSGEDYDVRVRNTGESSTVAEVTDPDNPGRAESGYVEFEPADTATTQDYIFQHRTDPGTNSSTTFDPVLIVGIEL
jgi:hypothetical protein